MPYAWSPVNKAQVADEAAINALGAAVTAHDALLAPVSSAWVDYSTYFAANWTGVVNPSGLGDSTIVAGYQITGTTLEIAFSIIIGASFVAGTGPYSFALPPGLAWKQHRRALGNCHCIDGGIDGRYGGTCIGRSTGQAFRIGFGTSLMGHATPQVWAATDEIWGNIRGELL